MKSFLVALFLVFLSFPLLADLAPMDVAPAALVSEEVPGVAVVVVVPAAPVAAASIDLSKPVEALQTAKAIREGIRAHDWGLVISLLALAAVFLLTRFVTPYLHGGIGVKFLAAGVGWATYVGCNVVSGMTAEDILFTAAVGLIVSAIAVWSPPTAAKPKGEGAGTVSLIVLSGLAGLLVASSCCQTPAIKAGNTQISCMFDNYVRADPVLTPAQQQERLKMSMQHRMLLGEPVVCPEVGR